MDKNNVLASGTYDILRKRFLDQKADLLARLKQLDEERKAVFGSVEFALSANERISTDNSCKISDIFALGSLCIVGHNTFLGLKSEIELRDVFSAYVFENQRFEPHNLSLIEDETFLFELHNMYKYYRHTRFVRFFSDRNHVYFVFQLSESMLDIKAFKWVIKETSLHFVDARSAGEVKWPQQYEFGWVRATRDMQRTGRHPHVSIADKVFVEAIGGDITIKVEDNTDTGLGIYSEEVAHKDQTLDDAEIHFFDYKNIVILKIKPFQESERYYIYNHKEKKVRRIHSLRHAAVLLPDNQGVIFADGYALQSGETKIFPSTQEDVKFLRKLNAPNGEDFAFIFYNYNSEEYVIQFYNIIRQSADTPLLCKGFTFFEDGTLAYTQKGEDTKHHLIQIWNTPFSKEFIIPDTLRENALYKIGNRDLVHLMAECHSLVTLMTKEDTYDALYDDVVKQATSILDGYYFVAQKEIFNPAEVIKEIRNTAHTAINEYEKIVEVRRATTNTVNDLTQRIMDMLKAVSAAQYKSLQEYVDAMSHVRLLMGDIAATKELKFSDVDALQELENQLLECNGTLAQSCAAFLLDENAMAPYWAEVESIHHTTQKMSRAIEAKDIESQIQKVSEQLTLLIDVVNGLKIEDTAHSTQIIEHISQIFARLNQERLELTQRRREISGRELTADFAAQMTLFDQSVVNLSEMASTPEACDDFLSKLSIQLEDMEAKFVDFDEYISAIQDKREEIYRHFESKKVQITEATNKRTTHLLKTGERLINGIKNKALSLKSEQEINGFFATDLMVDKVRETARTLTSMGDTNKAEELNTLVIVAQQEALRKLKDKKELYEDDGKVITLGEYKFAVSTTKRTLTLVLKDNQYFYHITGTSYYEAIDHSLLEGYKEVWQQEFVSENKNVARYEYIAWEVFKKHPYPTLYEDNLRYIGDFMTQHYGENLVKGIHDVDAAQILDVLQHLSHELDVLRYSPEERALAQIFWFFLNEGDKVYFENQFKAVHLIRQAFDNTEQFGYLNDQLAQRLRTFAHDFGSEFDKVSVRQAAVYLKLENRSVFQISSAGAILFEKFLNHLKNKGKDIQFMVQLESLYPHPAACYFMAENALNTYVAFDQNETSPHIIKEVAAFLVTKNLKEGQKSAITIYKKIEGLNSLQEGQSYAFDYYDFVDKMTYYSSVVLPQFRAFQSRKMELIAEKNHKMRLESFDSQVLTSFVRNKLINQVYLPMIGANFAKQLGVIGETKRTDRMGMLLLVSPPGYGKTTLMEYVADRLGLVFMKINGPSIGHHITSTDPNEAKNAGAKLELEKLNLAFEMGDNVMLYLDDIQHCHPEFLQKFISLADGQRKVEGIFNGVAKTYDFRSKRFCLVMAGNPYTETGDIFRIPDMLANRADIYNLGDIVGQNDGLFELSMIENALMSNDYMQQLTKNSMENLYKLYDAIKVESPIPTLESNMTEMQIQDHYNVLKNIIQVRNVVLKANQQYIQSAAMEDSYRLEPSFKLQGSYRDMNKLVSAVHPIMSKDEIDTLLLTHYKNESQTLTSSAEANLLKMKELMNLMSEADRLRWQDIKTQFLKNKVIKGLGSDDRMSQVVALLSEFNDHLEGIKEGVNGKNVN